MDYWLMTGVQGRAEPWNGFWVGGQMPRHSADLGFLYNTFDSHWDGSGKNKQLDNKILEFL
jgi:hypothetical protein